MDFIFYAVVLPVALAAWAVCFGAFYALFKYLKGDN